nr:8-oxo-dGTP diphosphatase [uncultured Dysosmobacter sp.]
MINTTLCYLERDEEYLMLHRTKKENDLNHDKWIGVGGKFQDGESPEDCLVRETWEETGLTLTHYLYRGLVTFVSDQWPTEYMHLFTADGWTGTPHPCDEGELAWIKKSELRALPLWEGDKIFLDLLDRDVPFFSLKLRYEGEKLVLAVLNGEWIVDAPRLRGCEEECL